MTYQSPVSRSLFAWFVADFSGEVITVLIFAALAFLGSDQMNIATVLGGVAAAVILLKLYRRSELGRGRGGLFYCAKCQYYYPPQDVEGKGAI